MRGWAVIAGIAIAFGCAATGSAEAQQQQRYRIGKVVDGTTGKPIRNVTVAYRQASRGRQVRWWQGRPTGWRTEGDGTFRVQSHLAGSEVVAIDPDRGCSAFGVLGDEKDRVVLKLYDGNTVTGVARDAHGKPVPELKIAFRVRGVGHSHESWLDGPGTLTDADGRYTLHGLPPGLEFRPGVEQTPRIRGVAGTPEVVKFEGLGESTKRDLIIERRPGVEITWNFTPPEGAPLPPTVRVTWINRQSNPADSTSTPATRVNNRDGTMEVRSHVRDGDQLITHTQRAWDHAMDPDAPALTLFWPVGAHALQVSADNWIATVPEEEIAGAAEPETRTLAFTQRARLYVQITDPAGEPIAQSGVRVTVNHTIRRTRSSHGFSAGNGTTDAGGLFEVTPFLPPLGAPPAEGTTIQVRVHLSSNDLTFPSGGFLKWSLDELHALMEQGGPGGHLVLAVEAVPPVEQAFKFVDLTGRPVQHQWIHPQIAGGQRGQSNADGTVTLKLPGGTHSNARFHLGNEFEMDPLPQLTIPSDGVIEVKVRRVLQFQVVVTVQGQTRRPPRTPGNVACKAYDAKNRLLRTARAWFNGTATNWVVYVRVPGNTDRVNLTLAGTTKLVRITGGRPPAKLAWTVPDLLKQTGAAKKK